jgi:hypothetical protein
MLEKLKDTSAVARRQRNPFMARHDFFGSWQRGAQYERRQIQPFVRSCRREHTLFFTRCSELNSIIARG